MNRSTSGLPVHHQLPESTQTHVHRVSDAIGSSHPSVAPFSSYPHSFPASGSFQMSQLFASCGQSIGVSASTSVLPVNTQDSSPLEWTGWISLQSKSPWLLRVKSLQHHSLKALILQCSAFFIVQVSHPYMTPGKTIALTRQTFVGKVMFSAPKIHVAHVMFSASIFLLSLLIWLNSYLSWVLCLGSLLCSLRLRHPSPHPYSGWLHILQVAV